MSIVDEVKAKTDCRELIARDLGAPKTGGSLSRKWWAWLCPFHTEKTPSFQVTADHWFCFGCRKGGDAITWMMRYHGMELVPALKALGADTSSAAQIRAESNQRAMRVPKMAAPPEVMQETFRNIVADCEKYLRADIGQRARTYLYNRGFTDQTLFFARLGYVPGKPGEYNRMHGVRMPTGITIPWFASDAIWGIKVRTAHGAPKYTQPSGGKIAESLYLADDIAHAMPILFVEGEFNALAAWQVANDFICPVSMGSASSSLNIRWFGTLAGHKLIAIFDKDKAGEVARARFSVLGDRVRMVTVPDPHKDLNEFLCADEARLRDWLGSLTL